jgi:hypothetical protein
MKTAETISRLFLGVWFLICAVDGWAYLLFDIHMTGEPRGLFFSSLVATTWFWTALKIVQTVCSVSLLTNFRPALGLALATPISFVLCLFYFFEVRLFIPMAILLICSTIILGRAYAAHFRSLLVQPGGKAAGGDGRLALETRQ